MGEVTVELCPETGICTIMKADAGKVDLLPDEVAQIREAAGDAEGIRATLAEADKDFAGKLDLSDLGAVAAKLG